MFMKLFFIWAPCAAITGYIFDGAMTSLSSWVVPLLILVMLCMGLTLRISDFLNILQYKKAVLVGIILQFTVMPITALILSHAFNLNQDITVGLVLVGSVAGGTSSNVMTYIAGGNVAMSVCMTAVSTLLSVVMTPYLLTVLVGSQVFIPASAILISLFKIILLPIALGVTIGSLGHKWVVKSKSAFASFSIIAILMIIAIVVALNKSNLTDVSVTIIIATLAHNISGLILGYLAAFLLGFDRVICRTLAIEAGMQNSGLATALALKFFSPITALPGAIFSIWLNITGSIFASICLHLEKPVTNDKTQKCSDDAHLQAR